MDNDLMRSLSFDLINKIKPDINKEGIIFDINGNKIGVHKGIANYTVGQRKGVGVGGQEHPLYVQEVNKNQNYIVLAQYESLQKNKIQLSTNKRYRLSVY